MGERGKWVVGIEEGTCWDEHWVLYGNQFVNKLYLKKKEGARRAEIEGTFSLSLCTHTHTHTHTHTQHTTPNAQEGTFSETGVGTGGPPPRAEGLTALGEGVLPGSGVLGAAVPSGCGCTCRGREGAEGATQEHTWARRVASGSWVPTCLWYTRTRGLSSFSRVSR